MSAKAASGDISELTTRRQICNNSTWGASNSAFKLVVILRPNSVQKPKGAITESDLNYHQHGRSLNWCKYAIAKI